MKTKIAAALLATAAMVTTACEQHDWKETSQLFKTHEGHGEAHGTTGEHATAGQHVEAGSHDTKKPEAAKH